MFVARFGNPPHLERSFVTFSVILHQFVDVVLINSRSAFLHITVFFAWIDRNNAENAKRLHSDNAGEYLGMERGLQEKGIISNTATHYFPQSNCLTQRLNQTLMDNVRVVLRDAGIPCKFRLESLNHAARLHICTMSSALD